MNGETPAQIQFPGLLCQVVNDAISDGLEPEYIVGVLEVVKTELLIKRVATLRQPKEFSPKIVLPNGGAS